MGITIAQIEAEEAILAGMKADRISEGSLSIYGPEEIAAQIAKIEAMKAAYNRDKGFSFTRTGISGIDVNGDE